MTKHEFLNIMRRLMVEARRAELLGKITDACGAAGYDDVGDFIDSLWEGNKKENVETTGPIVEEYDFLLGPIMKEIWESGYRFWDCTNPKTLTGFIDPYNGHWTKYFSDFVGRQPDTWGFIYRRYRENKEAGTLLGPKGKPNLRSVATVDEAMQASDEIDYVANTITGALNDAVRKKAREAGEDSA